MNNWQNNCDGFSKIFSSVVSGYSGVAADFKEHIKKMIINQLKELNLVTKEEFDVVKEMLAESRKVQEKLIKKLDKIEASLKK